MKPLKQKDVEPVSMPPSSSISTMDDAGPQSLFVVVSYIGKTRYFSSILQLDTKANKYEYVAHFERPQGYPMTIRWMFSHVPCSPCTPEDLCMVSDWGPSLYQKRAPLLVSLLNLTTKKFQSIKPRGGPIYYKNVVDMGDHIYFMGDPKPGYEPSFARYNRLQDSWETLEPFPYSDLRNQGQGLNGIIAATAVWNNNTILLSMVNCGTWAYDVATNKWYRVFDRGCQCDKIVGKAVILENTIYALTKTKGFIVSLSIRREQTAHGIEFIITLLHDILVPGIDVAIYQEQDTCFRTRDFVHLGGDNLCIVQSGNLYNSPAYSQPIRVTYLKLQGKTSMTLTNTRVYDVELLQNEEFRIKLCFSLPEYKATAFKEGNRYFAVDPIPDHFTVRPHSWRKDPPGLVDFSSKSDAPLQFLDNDSSQTNMIDEQGSFKGTQINNSIRDLRISFGDSTQELKRQLAFLQSSRTNMSGEKGNCIHVFNIPPGVTVKQLEKSLKKFGPITSEGIKVALKNDMPYATVEFKAAPSKQRAIKASTIDIQGFKAVIGEVEDQTLWVNSRTIPRFLNPKLLATPAINKVDGSDFQSCLPIVV